MITDSQRLQHLLKEGYLPKDTQLVESLLRELDDSAITKILDFFLDKGFAPSYWREAKVIKWSDDGTTPMMVEKSSSNGLVFVRNGDRERIDQVIERLSLAHLNAL
jgi:hypothetical protein